MVMFANDIRGGPFTKTQLWAATVQRPWAAATGDFTQISHDKCFVTFFVETISFNFVEKGFLADFMVLSSTSVSRWERLDSESAAPS